MPTKSQLKFAQLSTKPHINELGYEMVSQQMWEYLFAKPSSQRPTIDKIQQAQIKAGFTNFDGYSFPPDTVGYEGFPLVVPQFEGQLIDHINQLAQQRWGPIKNQLLEFLQAGIPKCPVDQILYNSGWTRYAYLGNSEANESSLDFDFDESQKPTEEWLIEPVRHPIEDTMVFDVETFVKAGNGPLMAVAVTNKAWYFWLHPSLASSNTIYLEQLIELGSGKLVLNHNPKFDSARVLETYDLSLGNQRNIWLDTLSMHMAVCGMSSKQRVPFKAYQKGSQTYASKWATLTSPNSLVEVYNLHVKPLKKLTESDKLTRNIFVSASDISQFRDQLDELTYYTLKDGEYTYRLGQALVPKYFRSQPHIISFGGTCILSKSFLPVSEKWNEQINQIERTYLVSKRQLKKDITHIANVWANAFKTKKLTLDKIAEDPWMSQLDWTPAKSGANTGMPLWWRKVKSKGISTKSRLAPLLLKMTWTGQPLVYHNKHGWIFKALESTPNQFKLPAGVPGLSSKFGPGSYSKVPHKKGDSHNCGSPLAKDYIEAIDSGLLSSSNPKAAEYLRSAKSIAYWTSMRSRALEQKAYPCKLPDGSSGLMVEPTLLYSGTTSRRCVESLWLTVSSAKKDVIGSELKGLVRAPNSLHQPGKYVMVGADFDAQELKIASAYCDAFIWLIFGSTPMGYTQLLGDKDKGTDGHTLLARFLNMKRDIAKNLNFQMLYLSGTLGCAMTIKSQRPELTETQCKDSANAALKLRRGSKVYSKTKQGDYIYKGGTDSSAYNFMMALANRKQLPVHLRHLQTDNMPRTPMLGSSMSEAITEANCGGDYLTSRANWTIQSSGVDILHTMLVLKDYFFESLQLDAQFMFSYHDELWDLVHEKDKLKAAWVTQICHLWTWAYFFQRLGFTDIPYQYQFFSGVNIDYCFRKEVYQSQITPSCTLEPPNGSMFKPTDLASITVNNLVAN